MFPLDPDPALKANGVVIVDGNSAVKDIVVRGEVPLGMTDTDDAFIAQQQGEPGGVVFPDQGEGQMGALVIPVPKGIPSIDAIKPMTVDGEKVADKVPEAAKFLGELFVR
jgi:hypothetical protein